MTPAYRFGFRITRHVTAGGRPRRRNAGAIPILAVCAVLATVGAVAAGIAHRNNTERAAQYAADPSCRASLGMKPSSAAVDGRCTIEFATVTVRYVHTYRRSRSYRLGLETSDGAVDSIELKGPDDKVIWDASPVRSAIVVQRFTDRGPGKRHVTLVTSNGLQARTAWNPAWQTMNTEIGMWFLGMAALVCTLALLWLRARRTPVAIPLM